MKHVVPLLLALPVVAYMLLSGCSDSAGVYYVHGWTCQPSSTQDCACEDSDKTGTQTCLEDGSAWGACSGCETALLPDGDVGTDGDTELDGDVTEDGDLEEDESEEETDGEESQPDEDGDVDEDGDTEEESETDT